MNHALLPSENPSSYFTGVGSSPLPVPVRVLLFLRTAKSDLQQNALQNRSHHRFVLLFNLKTAGHVHVDNLTFPLEPGEAMLIMPYQFHHYSHLASTELQWLFCTFDLSSATLPEPLRNCVIKTGSATRRALTALLEAWKSPASDVQAAQVQTGLLQLVLSLKKDRQQYGKGPVSETRNPLLQTVNQLLAEQRGRSVVKSIAGSLRLSESRARALFKEAAGIPLGKYLLNYRIHRAMALLQTTDLPIASVAEEAGFGSPQAFSRVFKRETGQSPRVYRGES